MRRCRTWWALPGRLGSANERDAFYCFARPTGSRSKTEFIGFAGRRARTAPAGGLLFSDFQVHGSRSKTEFIDFAGRRTRTAPAGGLLFRIFRSTVRARKPSSLALRAGGRELRRPASSFFRIFRSAVRARKPSSLALRAGGREPHRPAGSFFRIFRSTVRARKPSSLTLRAGVREPRRPAGCVQMKRDARKAPPTSVHLFPLLYFQKERIDDELTLSPRRRQFPPLLRDRSKLEVFHGYLYGGSQQRFRSNSYS